MKSLCRIHGPGDGETECGERERNQEDGRCNQAEADDAEVNPDKGSEGQEDRPWIAESVAPPRTLPSTMALRLTGATSTVSKNPSLRSSINDIMAKIEVNRTIIVSAPGKKKSR